MRTNGSILLLIGLLAGCQRGSGLEKVHVEGNVSYGGKAVEYGVILFRPIEGTLGPSNSTIIRNGRYEMRARGGVPVGKHRIEVTAFENTGTKLAAGLPESDLPSGPQFIPPRYNQRSTLVFEAVSAEHPLVHDLALTAE